MSDMTYAFKVMASLLLEAELKDAFKDMVPESTIRITLNNNVERNYVIIANLAGRIIMRDISSKIEYTFTKDSLNKDGVLTMHIYDKNSPSLEGKEEKLSVKEFVLGKKNGDIENIDLKNEMEERMNDMNQVLKSAKKGSIITISSEEKTSDTDGIVNNIFLRVNDVTPKKLSCTLEDVKSDGDSKGIKRLISSFRNRNIYITINDLVKMENNDLILNLKRSDLIIPVTGLLDIEVEGGESGNTGAYTPMTKQELIDKINSSPHSEKYKEAMDKTPSFWDTLMNATPKGVNQMNQILDKAVNKNSYLTLGRQLRFELMSKPIIIDNNIKLLNSTKLRKIPQSGKVEKGNVIISGRRRTTKGHWELKILKELSDDTFKVRITYCDSKLNCQIHDKDGIIKIIE